MFIVFFKEALPPKNLLEGGRGFMERVEEALTKIFKKAILQEI